ncbi:hypothetical protein B0H13DRAFT_1871873 [Mycena leptocephala]|nr:hypothetical protein B0H13DRAFT_1871873 [Mycena leptocephala]
MADVLVSNARLKAALPLPVDTDLSESEQKQVQAQIPDILDLHPAVIPVFWDTFAANHLTEIAVSLGRLSLATQREAVSTAIQILSLIPDPKDQLYFRKFLRNATASKDLPRHHCTLIINTLIWCDPRLGDDGKAPLDAEVRTVLFSAVQTWLEHPQTAEWKSTSFRNYTGFTVSYVASRECPSPTTSILRGNFWKT